MPFLKALTHSEMQQICPGFELGSSCLLLLRQVRLQIRIKKQHVLCLSFSDFIVGGFFLWNINLCGIFRAKSCFPIYNL